MRICPYLSLLLYLVIINAPRVFTVLWSFLKPMLHEDTLAKITVVGEDLEKQEKAFAACGITLDGGGNFRIDGNVFAIQRALDIMLLWIGFMRKLSVFVELFDTSG